MNKSNKWNPVSGDIVCENGKPNVRYIIYKHDGNEFNNEWFISQIMTNGIGGGFISTYCLKNNYELVGHPKSLTDVLSEQCESLKSYIDTSQNKVSFEWNLADVEPDNFNLPVLCKTNNGKLLVFKNTATMYNGDKTTVHSGWKFLVDKYNIKYWIYQNEV